MFNYQQQSDMLPQGLFSLRTDLDSLRKRVKTGFYRPKPRRIDQSVNVWEEEDGFLGWDDHEGREINMSQTERKEEEISYESGNGNEVESTKQVVEDVNQVKPTEVDNQNEEKDVEAVETQSVASVSQHALEVSSSLSSQMEFLRQTPGLSSILPALNLSGTSPIQSQESSLKEVPLSGKSEAVIDSKSDNDPSSTSSRHSSFSKAPTPKQRTPLDIDCSFEAEEDLQTVVKKIQPYIGPKYKSIQLPLIPEPELIFQKDQEPQQDENKEKLLDSLYSALVSGILSNTPPETKPSTPIITESNPLFKDYKVYCLPPLYNVSPYLVSYNNKHILH